MSGFDNGGAAPPPPPPPSAGGGGAIPQRGLGDILTTAFELYRANAAKLITIVAESVLADPLVALLKDAGATGYTLGDVRGEGSRGRRVGEIPGENIRIEVIASGEVTDVVLSQLAERYFPHYAIAAWVVDAEVARGEKYG